MNEDLWKKTYSANEAIWRSTEFSNARKENAWRTQKLLLAQKTRDLNENIHYAVLKDHQDKLQRVEEKTILERLERCQKIVDGSRRMPLQKPLIFRMPDASVFESPCTGIYESCQGEEVSSFDLQQLSPSKTEVNPGKRSSSAVNSCAAPAASSSWPGPEMSTHSKEESKNSDSNWVGFRTALEQKALDDMKKNNQQAPGGKMGSNAPSEMMNFRKKTLGGRRTVNSNFVSPVAQSNEVPRANEASSNATTIPSSLAHLDAKMVEQILGESIHNFKPVAWEDIAGLESAKSTFLEAIIMPLRRPDLFTGVRCPPRGVLLFGPPGTGKTLIAKSIASQARAKFFSINPSTLTSKWVGEAEKLVKTLFAVAAAHQPAIIFIDEVDSLLSKRSGNENESTLRLKNEFLIHLDGAASSEETRILVIGATNRPQELDEAVRRRFVRRLYVPLPTKEARLKIIEKLIRQVKHSLNLSDVEQLAELMDGYSGADVDSLCRYASMAPLRSLSPTQMEVVKSHELPAVTIEDFKEALKVISKSVSAEDCQQFVAWNEIYGVKH
ncbi:uncharacterized protein Dana_GF15688 [Drosophila ananassae]|uniref:AAA+ ATPase domain-containing protein n=1 Tax=Drosophila ananassae TaxID=7217 RepID=B3MNY0_DROAN|nr:fidgetin-like protein 1 [Drosophila ananassae]EDV32167.1 uncharacterized protein Dana_GF15688 [Drosophila ananassae]